MVTIKSFMNNLVTATGSVVWGVKIIWDDYL